MTKGVIEGKRANEYESKVMHTLRSKRFDAIIIENVKGKFLRVCDFACGPGNNITLLNKKVSEIVGVDLSGEMIKICGAKFATNKKVKLAQVSITDTKLKSDYFDYVIIRMGLHHVKDKDKVLEEAHRILKPKGKFLIIDRYYLSPWEQYSKGLWKLLTRGNPAVFQEYLVSKEKCDNILSNPGFKIIKNEILPYDKLHIGQDFMCFLEKQ